jgi:integrase/recombinase XerD
MDRLHELFHQFLRERIYLHNITPKTRDYYLTAWKAFERSRATAASRAPDAPVLTRADLQQFVVHLRERGVKPVTCNCWLRGLNAFGRWLHAEGKIPGPVRVRPQNEERRLLPLLNEAALRLLITYRPKTFVQWRVYAVAATMLDTGCRIEELLTARVTGFDFENLLLTVVGKGRKERRVPFSTELRKVLFRFAKVKAAAGITSELMFPERGGGKWEHRNARRSYYWLLKNLGLPKGGFHLLRHTFATQYLRNGGDVVRLSIILGHSEVSTTMKYLHLLTDDLQRPHQSLSLLNRLR